MVDRVRALRKAVELAPEALHDGGADEVDEGVPGRRTDGVAAPTRTHGFAVVQRLTGMPLASRSLARARLTHPWHPGFPVDAVEFGRSLDMYWNVLD